MIILPTVHRLRQGALGLLGAAFCAVSLAQPPGDVDTFFKLAALDRARDVQTYLLRGWDPNLRNAQGWTPLLLALREQSWQAAEELIQAPGLDLEATNPQGETALMLCAIRGQTALMKRLLDRGASPQRDGQWAPIHYAASSTELGPLDLILARQVPVDARALNGSTALMMAAGYGDHRLVDVLLKAGAQVDARNASGWQAADFAQRAGREKLAQQLRALHP